MVYQHAVGNFNFTFPDLKTVLAKASPEKSGDQMAGLAASSEQEKIVAKLVLADLPLKQFLTEEIIPSEIDNVSQLIAEAFDAKAFETFPILRWEVLEIGFWIIKPTEKRST